jgi:CDP-diacylglycerol--glycerol-3-phosphate 3-phosphatidyltransferase
MHESPLPDLIIAIVMISAFVLLGAAYGLRWLIVGRVRHARTESDGGSLFLNKPTMEMVYWVLNPIIGFIAGLGITPNMVTLFSLVPAAGAAVALGFGWFGLASALATLSTFCDIIDGLLARKIGRSSASGEVIDAAVDRYCEMFLLGGLVYYYREHDQVLFIVLAAIAAGFMVSYATAKAEAMGVAAPRGAMRRGERAAYMIVGFGFTPVAKTLFANSPSLALHELPIILGLTIIAVVGNISVVQRFLAVIAALRDRESRPPTQDLEQDPGIGAKPDAPVGSV